MEQIIHMNDLSVFRINQTGYAAGLPVCISYLGEGTVHLTDHSGNTIRKITCPRSPVDKASGDPVSVLNLGFLPEGRYKLESNGFSRNISVSQNPWQSVMEMMAKGLYFQRCGCDLKKEFAGIYAHPACHTAPAADWENRETFRLVTGGWHDAGDY
jgi:endoglucanase